MAETAKDKSGTTTPENEAATETPPVAALKARVSQAEIDEIIRKHVYGAMALGLAPVPLIDVLGLIAIQMNLVRSLAQKHEVSFQSHLAKPVIASLVGGVVPVAITPMIASFVKVIPVIGYTTGAASLSLLGAGATYAVGRVFADHFAAGGSMNDFDVNSSQATFKKEFEKGKAMAGSSGSTGAAAA
ncbi:uncharacterized protein (DUF697 family) [Constrictibacter sp. MBR-5]|uniref:YcjF family protein n=1 Tax=Constrictibacter sp. MBR-5 TaxID=3156467 RepID=UPI0033931CC1